jgi:hypothetical protein
MKQISVLCLQALLVLLAITHRREPNDKPAPERDVLLEQQYPDTHQLSLG